MAAGQIETSGVHDPASKAAATLLRKVSPHWLRHSTLTAMLLKGVSLPVVRDFAGHTDVSTTNTYLHSVIKELDDASRALTPPIY